ncbi:helix-turn-helix domain-containing protein [Romboutsia ilealis]|uniref:helix-turn-helix domain-containing protein n=1 Tax=Romboutsia ilealis TaxID=1115758 RepID=UPI0025745A07|nr:helix-turn-helix transcriptional regulator [Romboutsia ilealis]
MERENLKKYRISLKKSQNEMANLLGITLSFYSKIELGLKNPSLNTIKRFKEIFPNADVEKFFLS